MTPEIFNLPKDTQKMIDKHGESGELADGGGTWDIKKINYMTPEAQQKAIEKAVGYTGFEYLNDLNAMHEAEKVLIIGKDLEALYWSELQEFTGKFRMWHATSAQRSQAFLKTLGLWKEETQSDNQQKGTNEDKR